MTKPNQKKLPYILGCKAQHNTGINLRTNETGPFLRSKVKRIYLTSDKYPLPEFISTIKWTLHYCINTVNKSSVFNSQFFWKWGKPNPNQISKNYNFRWRCRVWPNGHTLSGLAIGTLRSETMATLHLKALHKTIYFSRWLKVS